MIRIVQRNFSGTIQLLNDEKTVCSKKIQEEFQKT